MPPSAPPSFGATLKTPGIASKKNLLKSLVKKTKPTSMSIKKASIKGVMAKAVGKGVKANAGVTGGSPFPLNGGLGTVNSAQMSPQAITSGAGSNLGVTGAF